MSGNDEKESGNPRIPETSKRVDKPTENGSASKKYPELYENDEVVKRQMEMISESLAACKRMSKRRSPKREVDDAVKPEVVALESSPENQLDERKLNHGHPDDHNPAVSYILKEKIETQEETQEMIKEGSSNSGTFFSSPEVSDQKETSQIGMYKPEEVDPMKMIEVIQRELKSLLKMAPAVSLTVNEVLDTVIHYQSCSKCKAKIRSTLPWILNKIQELIKYVTKKRRGAYIWPNDYSFLRLQSIHSLDQGSSQGKKQDTKPEIVLSKLEKVDVITTSDCKPGLQIQLEVKPEKTKKHIFSKRIQISKSLEYCLGGRYPTERPKESSLNFLFQVEKPSRPLEISWKVKRSIFAARGRAAAVLFLPRYKCPTVFSELLLVPVSWVTYHPKETTTNGVVRLLTDEGATQVEKMRELEIEVKGLKDLMREVHKNQMELSKIMLEKGVYSQTIIRLTDPKMLEEENEVVRKAAHMEITQQENSSTETIQRIVDNLKRKCAVKNKIIVTLLKGLRADVPNEWWEELVDFVFDPKPDGEFEPEKMSEFIRQTSAYLLNKVSKEPLPMMVEEEKPSEGYRPKLLYSQCQPPKTLRLDSERIRGTKRTLFKEEGQQTWNPKPEVEWNVLLEDLLSTTAREVSSLSEANGFSPSNQFPSNFFTFPASIEYESKPEVLIKKLENQVLLLNAENARLWNEVNDLRTLLKTSVEESHEMENVNNRSSRGLSEVIKTSGKTINLTIQIGDKDNRRSSRMKVKNPSAEEWCLERGKSKSSPVVKCASGECDTFPEMNPRSNLSEHERKLQQKCMTDPRYQFHSNGNRSRPDVDLTSLDDTYPTIPDWKEGNERLRNFLREKIESVHVMVATPRPSQHDFQLQTNISEPGPSKETGNRRPNLTNLFLKPSLIQLVEKPSQYPTSPSPTITIERELQTIPENDSTFSTTSDSGQNVDQALEILRAKVKSIYKDVTVLKLKNDRMDKLLDRLLEEALENSRSFLDVEHKTNGLRERQS